MHYFLARRLKTLYRDYTEGYDRMNDDCGADDGMELARKTEVFRE